MSLRCTAYELTVVHHGTARSSTKLRRIVSRHRLWHPTKKEALDAANNIQAEDGGDEVEHIVVARVKRELIAQIFRT